MLNTNKPLATAYIDSANIEKGISDLGFELDLDKFKTLLFQKYNCHKFVYFTGKILSDEYYKELETIGYEIVFKEAVRSNGKLKANCDVDLAHRLTLDIERKVVDQVILCSGDGDFAALLDFAKLNNLGLNLDY
jgi:uncharacterized LabA/DUF88 family protein